MSEKMTNAELLDVLTKADSKVVNVGGVYLDAEFMTDLKPVIAKRMQEHHMADLMGDDSLKLNLLERLALQVLRKRAGIPMPNKS